jgi:hypothetical protein
MLYAPCSMLRSQRAQTKLRGLNNKKGGIRIIGYRLKAEWGVLDDKNELACCCSLSELMSPPRSLNKSNVESRF